MAVYEFDKFDLDDYSLLNFMIINNERADDIWRFVRDKEITSGKFLRLFELCEHNVQCPLGTAAQCGNIKILKLLINLGFDPETPCVLIWPNRPKLLCQALHLACVHGQLDVVRTLIEDYKVDVNTESTKGNNALFCAIDYEPVDPKVNLDIVKYLISAGAFFQYDLDMKYTALHHCAQRNRLNVCEYFISSGVPVDTRTLTGTTPLKLAVQKGNLECAELLLRFGADSSQTDTNECSLLHHAVLNDDINMVKILCLHNIDPDFQDRVGAVALHYAVNGRKSNSYRIVRYLVVDVMAAMNKINIYRETPFSIALQLSDLDKVRLFLAAGYQMRAFEYKKMCPGYGPVSKFLQEHTRSPLKLEDICCFKIRAVLDRKVSTASTSLPLPVKLKELVTLSHIPHNVEVNKFRV